MKRSDVYQPKHSLPLPYSSEGRILQLIATGKKLVRHSKLLNTQTQTRVARAQVKKAA